MKRDNHNIETCLLFLQTAFHECYDQLKDKRICSKCLKPSHTFSTCNFTCKLCRGCHYYLLCKTVKPRAQAKNHTNSNETPSTEQNETTNTVLLQHSVNNKIVLPTARTFVVIHSQKVPINVALMQH